MKTELLSSYIVNGTLNIAMDMHIERTRPISLFLLLLFGWKMIMMRKLENYVCEKHK